MEEFRDLLMNVIYVNVIAYDYISAPKGLERKQESGTVALIN